MLINFFLPNAALIQGLRLLEKMQCINFQTWWLSRTFLKPCKRSSKVVRMATQSTLYSPFNAIRYEVGHGKEFRKRGLVEFDVRRTHPNSVRPVLPRRNFLSSFVNFFVSTARL